MEEGLNKLPVKVRKKLEQIFNDDIKVEDIIQSQYWVSSIRQGYLMTFFILKEQDPILIKHCFDIISFSTNLNETIKEINQYESNLGNKIVFVSTLAALTLRMEAIESMYANNEINEEKYHSLKQEVEETANKFILKYDEKIIVDFMEKLIDNSADRNSTDSFNNEFTQIFFTTELREGNKAIEQIIRKYTILKPENEAAILDRDFFNFQGENLVGILIRGGLYSLVEEKMPNTGVLSFLTTAEANMTRFDYIQEHPDIKEKTYFEQLSLKNKEININFDKRVPSTVLAHAIVNFLAIETENPQNLEKTQKALDCVIDLFGKLNKYIEELSQEQDEAKRQNGFKEINYMLNAPIFVNKTYTTIAEFLQDFEPGNEILDASLINLGIGQNTSPYGIKLHTLNEMNEIVKSKPDRFDLKIIGGMILETNLNKIKNAKSSQERVSILQNYISIKDKKVIINEDDLEALLESAQNDQELTNKIEMDIWTVIAKSYIDLNLAGHHIIAMEKWFTSKYYRLANVYLKHESAAMNSLLENKNVNGKILASLEITETNFPTIHRALLLKTKTIPTDTANKITTRAKSPEVLNELTRKRGILRLGRRLCDQKMSEIERKKVNKILTEGEFENIKSYEILLKNAKNNNDRVSILNRALKLKEFYSSELCLKYFKIIILNKKILKEDKEKLLNSISEENREIFSLKLLKSMSNKELVIFLNNVKIPENILLYQSVLTHIEEKLNKKTSFLGKTVLKSLNQNTIAIFSKHAQKVCKSTSQEQTAQTEEAEYSISLNTDPTPKKSQAEIETLIGSPIRQADKSIPSIIFFLDSQPDFENQAMFLARRAKLSKSQVEKLFKALKPEAVDIQTDFLKALLTNPAVNKDKDILGFIIESTRKTQDATLWKEATEYTKKVKKVEDPELTRRVARLSIRAK
ncbi:MAG: hypothetical protein PHY80_00195 [Rickettsiales bacterium]|nr:hypothetical protein [Rickettsiales bacterium]